MNANLNSGGLIEPPIAPIKKNTMFKLDNFYRIIIDDIEKATHIYAKAYSEIMLYETALEGVEDKILLLKSFFEIPIRFGIKYGFPYAPSEQLEGIAIWIPHEKAKLSMWRLIRSGGFKTSLKLFKNAKNFLTSLKGMSQLDEDRQKNMAGKRYLYLMNLAVDPNHQRKGIASRLLKAMFEKTDEHGYYMYVSADLDNVDFYKKYGFEIIKKINVEINGQDLPNWEMVRSPNESI